MREREWTDRPLHPGDMMDHAGLRVTPAPIHDAVMVTGDLTAAIADIAPGAAFVGLYAERGEPGLIRIARDKALCVGATFAEGWHGTFATSDASGLYACLHMSGPALTDALSEGTGADLHGNSPSAAVMFAGQTCLLTRQGETAELWVPAAMETYMTGWFLSRQ